MKSEAKPGVLKILIYGLNYAPELTGIGKYTTEMAEWMASRGHQVRVLASPPYYPAWKVAAPYSWWKYSREEINGVEIYRCPIWVPDRPGGTSRIIHLLSYALSSLPRSLGMAGWQPDVVLTIVPPLACLPNALLLAKICGAKSWIHIQDFEIDAAAGLGIVQENALLRLARRIESLLLGSCDRVSTISHAMLQHACRKGVAPDRAVLFPNWVDTRHIAPLPRGQTLRQQWGIKEDQIVLLYSGNLGKKQGLELIIQAARILQKTRPEFVFAIVGDGPSRADLEALTHDSGLTNVMFKPLQPVDLLPALLSSADIHLVLQRRGAADLVLPSKVGGILAAGGAMIVTADPDTELYNTMSQNHCALCIEPESAGALVSGIEKLLSDRALIRQLQNKAREFALANLDRDNVLASVERHLFALAGRQTE